MAPGVNVSSAGVQKVEQVGRGSGAAVGVRPGDTNRNMGLRLEEIQVLFQLMSILEANPSFQGHFAGNPSI